MKNRFTVTIKDNEIIDIINAIPKTLRSKVLEHAVMRYQNTLEGTAAFAIYKQGRENTWES